MPQPILHSLEIVYEESLKRSRLQEISPELAKLLDERVAEADANSDEGYTMEEVIEYVKRKK